jgi:predicted DNA-binding transcriptional regulator YafY
MRWLLSAIRKQADIRVEYQSMSRRNATWRWIAPHALGYDGTRWHVRAWCETHRDFRDFVLSRIQATDEMRPSQVDPEADRCWHEEVVIILAPNPELSEGAQRAIAKEY